MPASTSTLHKNLFLKKSTLFLLLCLCFAFSAIGQGNMCAEAEEFCPSSNGDDVTFPAGVNSGNAEPGNDYGCLFTFPNPAWYYIQIGQPGSITIQLTNSNNEDIDFALWGPFPDLNIANDNCGSLPNPTDCSYSGSANETVMIPDSDPGEIYILLITNFSNDPTDIFGEATGNGVPACCTTPINTGLTCPDPATFSCGCWTGGFVGVLPTTNPAPAPLGFCGTTENQQWVDVESCWCAVSVEVSAENCPNAQGIEAQLFSDCDPFTPISDCITVADGTAEFLTGLDGSTQINCEIGGTYTLLLDGIDGDVCSYTVTATEIPINPPVFSQDTIVGPSMVCFGDTVSYEFPDIDYATFCDATFTAADAEVINVTHEGFQVVFGETSGTLCIQATNCAGTTTFCMEITVEECCFSDPGSLFANDFVLCEGETAQVAVMQEAIISAGDTFIFVLHDGIGFPIGNIIEENVNGLFSFQAPMQTQQTYFIDLVTGRIGDNGEIINYDHSCLDFADNQNTLTYFETSPELEIGEITKVCDDLAAFYTIEFEISNGIQPYTVNGEILDNNFYVSPPIPAGDAYSFEITSVNFCLAPLTINGQEECPCETYAGVIEDEFTELCGNDIVQIMPTEAPVLDDNDVLVYVLRDATGETILENTTGSFSFQAELNYNQQYSICAYAGNNDGTGSPITDYACFSSSNCKDVVFYEDINIMLPDSVEITCDMPMPSVNSLITGGSSSYSTIWTRNGAVISEEADITVSEAGVYTLTVLDTQTDCESSESVLAVVAPVITGIDLNITDPTCFEDNDGAILIGEVEGGVPPFLYKLDDGFFTGNTELIALPASDYELTVQDANGCEFKRDAFVNQPVEVLVDLGDDMELKLGEEANISVESTINEDEGRVLWTINEIVQADTLFEIDSVFLESVLVQAMVSDTNGCFAEDMMRINIEQKDPIFVPTAFSPNGDGNNERLNVFGDISVVSINYMRIYDRWGSLLYDSGGAFLPNDTSVGWDGLYRGQRVNSGVYVYALEAVYVDGVEEVFLGDVLLVR